MCEHITKVVRKMCKIAKKSLGKCDLLEKL